MNEPTAITPVAAEAMAILVEFGRTSTLMQVADFCGIQEREDGTKFELWTIRESVKGLTRGSTVSRATIEAVLFPAQLPPAA